MSEKKQKKTGWKAEVLDYAKTIVITVVVVGLLSKFVIKPIRVEGSSMYPTLVDQDLGVANVLSVELGDINRFDIVIIHLQDPDEYLVKRVIGLPGETVSYKDGILYINQEAVEEDFLDESYKKEWGTVFMSDVEEITLQEGEYYCLGDNRPASKDSRYYGPFDKSQIVAKGAMILFPFSDFGLKSW